MFRLVFAVVLTIFLSCVLAETPHKNKNNTTCFHTPEFNASKNAIKNCFNDTVTRYLHPSKTDPTHGKCENGADMAERLDSYLKRLRTCNISLNTNTTLIKSLIDLSLKNNSFNEFYKNIDCVKNHELKISNDCVKNKVGYFNITNGKKHVPWVIRGNVFYSDYTCAKSKSVKDCVVVLLKDCGTAVSEYVASLFDHVRGFGHCERFNATIELPPIYTPVKSASWLSTPVKITLGVGAFVVGAAVIVVLVMKYRNK